MWKAITATPKQRMLFQVLVALVMLDVALVMLGAHGVAHNARTVSARSLQETAQFRISVDVVRVDAVVTDKHGHVVSDLVPSDFEIRQDGVLQKISSVQFVAVDPPSEAPAKPLRPGNVQRTFAVVMDDLSLSLEGLHYAQLALTTFVQQTLRPTDVMAITRTGGVVGATESFTTDRRVLLAAVDALQWNGFSRHRTYPSTMMKDFPDFDSNALDFAKLDRLRNSISADGTLSALTLAIGGVRNMPGRKAVILVSEGFTVMSGGDADIRVRAAMDRVVDEATRSGVVVYAIDARGLQTVSTSDTQEPMAYLAEQTGGFAVLNTNDLSRGFAKISEDLKGYYLLGYVPQTGTFAGDLQKARLHKISVRIKKDGLRVRAGRSFLGISDPPETPEVGGIATQLIRAARSPFVATDVALRASALAGYSVTDGSFVQALLHIDASTLGVDKVGQTSTTSTLDVLGLAFDIQGVPIAHVSSSFTVGLSDTRSDKDLREGLGYVFRIPIRDPGAYQVRFALRDRRTGRIGSAGEFVEVPDIAGGVFALSGLVLRARDENTDSASSGWLGLTAAQARQVYRRGTELTYSYEVYNARTTVMTGLSLWRGDELVFAAPVDRLSVPAGMEKCLPLRGSIRLNPGLSSGRYILEIRAETDASRRRSSARSALQRIALDVES
jgi:VWFA-related protein